MFGHQSGNMFLTSSSTNSEYVAKVSLALFIYFYLLDK